MNLLPRPRAITRGAGVVAVAAGSAPVVSADPALPPQGYRLQIGDGSGSVTRSESRSGSVRLSVADDAGRFYGLATLAQVEAAHAAEGGARGTLPEVVVEDWPDLAVRGVMLDISRDKVPTLTTLKALVDRLASWKVNHLQLYMEHTFAYRDHEAVWRDADPLTAEEVAELDAWCRDRHVELTPNQNCLGHMERWLKHEPYRSLAIAPDGWVDGRGRARPPTTLDPSRPESLELVVSLLTELLPNFGSRRVNVGLDEPWELPAAHHGEYVDYIAALRAATPVVEHELLVWGDIVATDPAMATRLPEGVTVCEWGYEANHPFGERAAVLREAGRQFWLCPGTSSWNSLLGRVTNMRGDCDSAAASAIDHGASGYLVTDWGDNGHLQYLPVSEPGFAYAAAVSWCREANRDLDLAAALDLHAYADGSGTLGKALLALGDAHRGVGPQLPNMSILALPLYSPAARMGEGWTEGLTSDDLSAVEEGLAAAADEVARSRSARSDAALVRDELATSAALVQLLCRDARARLGAGGRLDAVAGTTRAGLAEELARITTRHRDLWLARNRYGGLVDSVARLERLERAYRA